MRYNAYEERLLDQIQGRMAPWQARKPKTRVVWCLRCAVRLQWAPAQDSYTHFCGYPLSLYGPFEEPPSFFPTPWPLDPVWWIGDKPRESS